MTSVPFFVPFPHTLPGTYLVRLHQATTAIRARYLEDFRGGSTDWRYALWSPFTKFMSENSEKNKIPSPPIVVESRGKKCVVECPPRVWAGVKLDFSETLPQIVEESFFPAVMREIQKVRPQKIEFECPSEEALSFGYDKTPVNPGKSNTDVPTIHIFGTSILKDAAEGIEYLASKHSNQIAVQNHCREDTNDMAALLQSKNLPVKKHDDDCVVLLFLGNQMFKFENHKKMHGKFHYWQPKYLDDQEVNAVLEKTAGHISDIQKKFDGRIFILGPLPRQIEPCCSNPVHSFKQNPLFKNNLQYAFMLNKFFHVHPIFAGRNVEFIPYDKIFGVNFSNDELKDGVHLKKHANQKLCEFIANMPLWEGKKIKPTINPKPSFYTWVENVIQSAKNLKAAKNLPLTSTPIVPGKQKRVSEAPDLSQIAMDTTEKGDGGGQTSDAPAGGDGAGGEQPSDGSQPAAESQGEPSKTAPPATPTRNNGDADGTLSDYRSEDEDESAQCRTPPSRSEVDKMIQETMEQNPSLLGSDSEM